MLNRVLAMASIALAATVFAAALAATAHGEQPACTGDRHYDGVGCCPYVEETTTTSTTLPAGCPDPAPCPPVECKCDCGDDDSTTGARTTTINVTRCPDAPWYKNCWLKPARAATATRKAKPAKLVCANNAHPHRVLVPEPYAYDSDKK